MNARSWTAPLALLGLLAASCSSVVPEPPPRPPPAAFWETHWRVSQIDGQAVVPGELDREAFLVFGEADRSVRGSSGCNGFSGAIEAEGDALRFPPLTMTMMACPPPGDAREHALMQALDAVRSRSHEGDVLRLLDAEAKVRVLLEARSLGRDELRDLRKYRDRPGPRVPGRGR